VTTLHHHLAAWSAARSDRRAVAATVAAIATAGARLTTVIAQGALVGDLDRTIRLPADRPRGDWDGRDWTNGDWAGRDWAGRDWASGERRRQKALDRYASGVFVDHLRDAPVAQVATEEAAEVIVLNPREVIAVAIDPLNGTSNVDIDGPLGTVFSLLPSAPTMTPDESFLAAGSDQLAAGFILYGPHTALVLTLGDGVNIFTLDPRTREFVLTHGAVRITPGRREYAINASNGRHWPLPIRAFVEECVAGADGPRGVDYNTRWLGTVVSEAYRILVRGGIYLYPGDARPGYRRGRLRLLYEANPIAMLVEQAGGLATDGYGRILDLIPSGTQDHVPLIFGSADKVERVMELYAASVPQAGQRPLFATRGLFMS
jgi:fructose-1,6-bisphosphatase I